MRADETLIHARESGGTTGRGAPVGPQGDRGSALRASDWAPLVGVGVGGRSRRRVDYRGIKDRGLGKKDRR
jgi:hypothetical protein